MSILSLTKQSINVKIVDSNLPHHQRASKSNKESSIGEIVRLIIQLSNKNVTSMSLKPKLNQARPVRKPKCQAYKAWFITKIAKRKNLLSEKVLNSLSALIYCRALDTTTLRELIDSEGRLNPEAPELGVLIVTIPRPPRASMQDLYERMGSMEIRLGAIERMSYWQSYHWDMYIRVFKHMVGVYSVPLQGAYNPPGYD
ncbi:hypothetical protein Tco_0201797 [Tanacetum coccineum]